MDNVTESKRDVKGYICQSTVVPSEIRGQSVVSSQPFSIGDTLIGECYRCFEIAGHRDSSDAKCFVHRSEH